MGKVHILGDEKKHCGWDKDLPPAITIDPGDTIIHETPEVWDNMLTPQSTVEDVTKLDFDRVHQLSGPVYINGAEPGDVLQIDILDIKHKGWGWQAVVPGFGLLADEFPDPALKIFYLKEDTTEFMPGITIPLRLQPGVMGVASAQVGKFSTVPPDIWGDNMDMRHLTPGTMLYLPVQVPGAIFSVGDCHVAQGDGEICGTGIEAPLTVTLRYDVIKGWTIPSPQFVTKGPLTEGIDSKGYYVTTGMD